ncbi:MAG: hypothetical protein ABR538_01305 [Candidatus Binatia bacterium]
MNNWNKLGLAGFVSAALVFGGIEAHAACIDTFDNSVDNPADCLFADGGLTDQCRLAVAVDMDGAGTPPADPKKITCVDGAACDGDGAVNGACTFRVGACLNIPNAGCDVLPVSDGEVTKPSVKDVNKALKLPSAVYNRRALQDALESILPNVGEACTDADIPVKVDLKSKGGICATPAGEKCVSDLDCDDYCMPTMKKNKANVALAVTDSGKGAKAKFKLNCLPATAPFANGAEAFQIVNPADLIGGPLAMGRTGDYMIRNGNVRAVIRAPGRQHSFMLLNGGQIIDADLVRDNPADDRDSWMGIQPLVHISSSQATDMVTVENDGTDGNAAVISSSGPDDLFDTIKGDILVLAAGLSVPNNAVDGDLPVQISTEFTLTPYSNTIQMATKVTDTGGVLRKYYMGDFINPGGQLEPFGPGQGFGETQLRNGASFAASDPRGGQPLDYLAFQGGLDAAGVTYGLIFAPTNPGSRSTIEIGAFSSSGVYAAVHNNNLLNLLFASQAQKLDAGGFTVPANGSKTLRRWFHVGKTVGDVSQARSEIFARDKAVLQGVVTVGGAPVAGAHVTLLNDFINFAANCPDPDPENCVNIFSSTLTDEAGFYRMVVPPGEYRVAVRKAGAPYEGSSAEPAQTPVELKKKKTIVLDVALPDTGTVVVNVEDQAGIDIAAKVSVVGIPASPDPLNDEYTGLGAAFTGRFFGFDFEEKGDVFGLAAAVFADASGTTGSFNLEPGTYHVVVSHGYEYDVYDEIITVTAGGTNTVNAVVNQVVDTTGFVSIDTHVHMINSPDSAVSRERRIISMLAEGVDFFVNTDHDFTHDLSDEVAGLGVGALIGTAPSVEATTSHYGHFNIWPITVDGGQLAGGTPDWSFHPGDLNGAGYPSNGVYDLLPGEIYDSGQAYPGAQVIQVNHFNSGTLGHFNMLGIDTEQNPPASSNDVYRCVGGTNPGLPCQVKICLGGANDGNTCTVVGDCPGGTCPNVSACAGAGTCTLTGQNLGSYLRLDPLVANLYDDDFTALEVWIEAGRGQTALLRGDNMGDWFNLLNQGRFKAGTADSDTHSSISVQAGGPRTFVASSTDAPGSIDPAEIATNVNAMRAIGSNGPFMTVELENGVAATASHALGVERTVAFTAGPNANSINLHIEAPTWAEYDTIDVYMNSTPNCQSEWTFFGVINPSKCATVTPTMSLTKGVDFSVGTSAGVSGSGTRQVTDVSIPVTITGDTWVVVVVRGTDGVSAPLFPMQPQDLATAGNGTLAGLTDSGGPLPWNLGEQGALALAYSNPLFFDDGDNLCHGGTSCPGL